MNKPSQTGSSETSDVIRFSNPNPTCGTKFLLLKRLGLSNLDLSSNSSSCSLPAPALAGTSEIGKCKNGPVSDIATRIINVSVPKIPTTATHNNAHLPQEIISSKSSKFKTNTEHLPVPISKSTFKRKRLRLRAIKKLKPLIDLDCYCPVPVLSREPCELPVINKSAPAMLIYPYESNISQLTNDDSHVTGSITQQVLGKQPVKNNLDINNSGNSSETNLNLSISDDSRARVTLTPMQQGRPNNSSNITPEPEIITLSSDSANSDRTEVSALDSHSHSPSLLDNATRYSSENTSENEIQNVCNLGTSISQGSCSRSQNIVEQLSSDKPHCTRKTLLEPNDRSNLFKKRKLSKSSGCSSCQNCEYNYHVGDINKRSHKCLMLILSVLCNEFEISQNDCFDILKKNDFNIVSSLLELQSLKQSTQ